MRPLNLDGTWGQKQRREYLLDEDGNRIRDKNGDYVFNAVHTTDWHEPETLEHWREQWAAAVNTKFEEKGMVFSPEWKKRLIRRTSSRCWLI